jgi:hypothetical protein
VRGILRGKIHKTMAVWPAVTQASSSLPDEQRLCDLQEVTSPGGSLPWAAGHAACGEGRVSRPVRPTRFRPGARAHVYRALVIGTRAHTAVTTHILRSVRRLSLALA